MSKLTKMIGKQFSNPHGFMGLICCRAMNVINKNLYSSVLKSFNPSPNSKVLDIGFGNGYLVNKLYKQNNCNVFGIDISSDMLSLATKHNKKGIKAEKITLTCADCCALPFENETFDFITSINTIYFWPDTEKGLNEVYRVLKKGGTFFNAVYSKEWLSKKKSTQNIYKLFDENDYLTLGKKAGFSKVEIIEVKKGKSMLVKFEKN